MNGGSREDRVRLTWPCGCREWRVQTFTSAGEIVEDELLREEFCAEKRALAMDAWRLELNIPAAHLRPPRPPEVEKARKQHYAKLIKARGDEAGHPSLAAGMPTRERVEEIDEEHGS